MRKALIGLVTTLALAAAVLPSGAGQHFGVTGDEGGVFSTAMAFGPEGAGDSVAASGFFVRRTGPEAGDQGASHGSLTVCVRVETSLGADHGCVSRGGTLPRQPDATMSEDRVVLLIPSSMHRDGFIEVDLRWVASGAFEPDTTIDLPGQYLSASFAAGLARASTITGSVRSSTVGGGQIEPSGGFLTRGVKARVCSADGVDCSAP